MTYIKGVGIFIFQTNYHYNSSCIIKLISYTENNIIDPTINKNSYNRGYRRSCY